LVKWFTPHLQLGSAFQFILAATVFCQIITALVPDTVSWRRKIHLLSAYSMAILYVPLSILIINSGRLTLLPRVVGTVLAAYMLIGFILVAMMGRAKSRHLFFQASYIVAFQLLILVAAYLR
jgi:hypothetical protein